MDVSTIYTVFSLVALLLTLNRVYKTLIAPTTTTATTGAKASARSKNTQDSSDAMASTGGDAPAPRPVTDAELRAATGVGADAALYIALNDPFTPGRVNVFDVSSGRDFYGPGGAYHVFVGKNATHGLSTSSVDPDKVEGDVTGLTQSQKDTHLQWHAKYTSKYPIVGHLVTAEEAAAATKKTVAPESSDDTASVVTSETTLESKKDA